jgi:hypothetical protein
MEACFLNVVADFNNNDVSFSIIDISLSKLASGKIDFARLIPTTILYLDAAFQRDNL